MSILAEVFEQDGALEHLEAFTSRNGPTYYRLPVNEDTLTLTRQAPDYPTHIDTPDGPVTVFDPDMPLNWSIS